MTSRMNYALTEKFMFTKIESKTNGVINLLQPAIAILKNQADMTRLEKQYEIEIQLREYGRSEKHPYTFVFNPQIAMRNDRTGPHYPVGSVN